MDIISALRKLTSSIRTYVDDNKVQKVSGKGLSTNDYTNAEKTQLANLGTLVGDTAVSEQISDAVGDCITELSASGGTVTYTKGDGSTGTITTQSTGATYSAGAGISLSGTTISNSGVHSVSTGSANGTISVNTNGTSADVAVKGLGSAAYTASTAYDTAGAANTALTNAKSYTDGEISEWVGNSTVSSQISTAISGVTPESIGAVKKSGDTMTGNIEYSNRQNGIQWTTNDSTVFHLRPYPSGNLMQLTTKGIGTNNEENASFNIENDGSVWLGKPLPITSGGTGASDASTARTNLGITPTNIGAVDKAGDTITGTLSINNSSSNGYVLLSEDNEGGTITISGPNNTYVYEIDAYNDSTIRIHTASKHPSGVANQFLTWSGETGHLTTASLTTSGRVLMGNGSGVVGDDGVWTSYGFYTSDGKKRGSIMISDTNRIHFNNQETGSPYADRYMLPEITTGKTADSWYSFLTTKSAVTVAQGGTGATTAAAALTNLGVIPSTTQPSSPQKGMIWLKLSS